MIWKAKYVLENVLHNALHCLLMLRSWKEVKWNPNYLLFTALDFPQYKKPIMRALNKNPNKLLPSNWIITDPEKEKQAGQKLKEFFFHNQPISEETIINLINVSVLSALSSISIILKIHHALGNYRRELSNWNSRCCDLPLKGSITGLPVPLRLGYALWKIQIYVRYKNKRSCPCWWIRIPILHEYVSSKSQK